MLSLAELLDPHSTSIVLLGAGASADYGFPLWGELEIEMIQSLEAARSGNDALLQSALNESDSNLLRAVSVLGNIGNDQSLDAVVEENVRGGFFEFEQIFRTVVGYVISQKEAEDLRSGTTRWIERFATLIADYTVSEFGDGREVSLPHFVSLNYDRCFAHHFFESLRTRGEATASPLLWSRAVRQALSGGLVQHPHGAIGRLGGSHGVNTVNDVYLANGNTYNVDYGDTAELCRYIESETFENAPRICSVDAFTDSITPTSSYDRVQQLFKAAKQIVIIGMSESGQRQNKFTGFHSGQQITIVDKTVFDPLDRYNDAKVQFTGDFCDAFVASLT